MSRCRFMKESFYTIAIFDVFTPKLYILIYICVHTFSWDRHLSPIPVTQQSIIASSLIHESSFRLSEGLPKILLHRCARHAAWRISRRLKWVRPNVHENHYRLSSLLDNRVHRFEGCPNTRVQSQISERLRIGSGERLEIGKGDRASEVEEGIVDFLQEVAKRVANTLG